MCLKTLLKTPPENIETKTKTGRENQNAMELHPGSIREWWLFPQVCQEPISICAQYFRRGAKKKYMKKTGEL